MYYSYAYPYAYHPELFRFSDHYEDVFMEDGNYLYACAEAFDYDGSYTVREYHKLDNGYWLKYDHAGADYAYLTKLDHAPYDAAKDVMTMETQDYIAYSIPYDEDNEYFHDDEGYIADKREQWEDEYQEWCNDYLDCPKGWETVIA